MPLISSPSIFIAYLTLIRVMKYNVRLCDLLLAGTTETFPRAIVAWKSIVKKSTFFSCSSLEKILLKLQNDTVFVVWAVKHLKKAEVLCLASSLWGKLCLVTDVYGNDAENSSEVSVYQQVPRGDTREVSNFTMVDTSSQSKIDCLHDNNNPPSAVVHSALLLPNLRVDDSSTPIIVYHT